MARTLHLWVSVQQSPFFPELLMALDQAIASIRENHQDFIKQMSEQDLHRIIDKQDEDGR